MTLRPGNNTLPMTGILDQTKVLSSMDKSGHVVLLITGNSAVYNGQHLTYYVSLWKGERVNKDRANATSGESFIE